MTDDTMLASRAAALDLIEAVLRRRTLLDEAIEANQPLRALDPRDRAFARLLAATVLRRLGQLDAALAEFLNKPEPPKAPVHDILRLGAAQLLFLGTPAHAAVDTAVALTARRRQEPFRGLVNAILRRVARESDTLATNQDAPRLNTPDWLWRSWTAAYGAETARRIAEANLHEAPLDITAKSDPAAWEGPLEAQLLPTGTLRRATGGPITELPGFAEGAWWVQDAAAALPAKLLGDVAGRLVYDLCAAPGGKAAQLAAAGARVVAVDRSAKRLERVSANLARLGLQAELVAADAASWQPPAPADAILLDAPCSATGAIRRHPDVARLKSQEDVDKLALSQDRLLRQAVGMLKPGGVLVYCTCSIQPEEGEARIDALLESGAPVTRVPVRPSEVGGFAELVNARGELRTLPGQLADLGGIDGFFAARLLRR
ncbi:RsmB/NOP family class I SAM-dependent RNA methyltransferase [Arenibaculum pallidiluteum]|uniref:RsmB/NOP family class I SAM-dependent RNA methyltransferase n=1 Tax=Arenibaculum pallidiluteum TaxID=2812559 RepID=UPI001A972890|nr:transcription antitermination factor NusB [Arenibaculum pallidiluteum]